MSTNSGTVKSNSANHESVTGGPSCDDQRKAHHPLRLAIGRVLLWFIDPYYEDRERARSVTRSELNQILADRDAQVLRSIPSIMIDRGRRRGDRDQPPKEPA